MSARANDRSSLGCFQYSQAKSPPGDKLTRWYAANRYRISQRNRTVAELDRDGEGSAFRVDGGKLDEGET